jgi:hypothetical protein
MPKAIDAPEWLLVYEQEWRAKNALRARLVIDCAQLAFEVLGLDASFNMLWRVASQFVNPVTGNIAIGR